MLQDLTATAAVPNCPNRNLQFVSASLRPEHNAPSANLYHLHNRRRSWQEGQHGMDTTQLCPQHSTVSNLPGQWINPHVLEVRVILWIILKRNTVSNNLQKRFWNARCEMLLAPLVQMVGTLCFPQGTTRAILHWWSRINFHFQSSSLLTKRHAVGQKQTASIS